MENQVEYQFDFSSVNAEGGQINIGTEFGNAIYSIARDPRYKTFCEVGTWNGQGSTKCIYEGICNREGAILYSIEGDKVMYDDAVQIWKGVANVHLLFGTLHRKIMTPEEIQAHPLFPIVAQHYVEAYDIEQEATLATPIVTVPPCDVVLLDGGEFSTQGDWDTLKHPGLKCVILDDTKVIKTSAIRAELLADSSWKCIFDCQDDRNGWSIFERVGVCP